MQISKLGRYEIIEELGRGGMGIVYKGYDPILERYVAIKILPPKLAKKEKVVERFLREAKVAAKLLHPNIINTYDFGKSEDNYYMVMEFLEGKTLMEYIENRDSIDIDEVLFFFKQILSGVDYAHSHKVVHRDLKPDNIMIIDNDLIKIMDFGLAILEGEKSLTQVGTIMGTIAYFSPEQAKGFRGDYRSDIYSLGVILFESLTGKLPIWANSATEFINKLLNDPPAKVREFNPDVHPVLEELIDRLLKKDPQERLTSISQIYEYIDRYEKQKEVEKQSVDLNINYTPESPIIPEVKEKKTNVEFSKVLQETMTELSKEDSNLNPPPSDLKIPKSDNSVGLLDKYKMEWKQFVLKEDNDIKSDIDKDDTNSTKLLTPEDKLECRFCKTLNPSYMEFCINCGKPLKSGFLKEEDINSDINYKKAKEHFGLALSFYKDKNYEKALKELQQSISLQPSLIDAYYYLGTIMQKKGNFPEAISNYLTVIEYKQDHYKSIKNLAIIYYELDNYNDALVYITKALDLKPSAANYYLKGKILLKLSKYRESIQYFQKSLQLDESNLSAYKRMAIAYFYLNDLENSLFYLTKYLEYEKKDDEAYLYLIKIYRKQLKNKELLDLYNRIIQYNIKLEDAYIGLAKYFIENKELTKAEVILEKGLDILENFSLNYYKLLAELYYNSGKYLKARKFYEKLTNLKPDESSFHILLADVYLKLNKVQLALFQYEWAIALEPDNAKLHVQLGDLYLKLSRFDSAISEYKSAISLSDSPEYVVKLAMVYYNKKEYNTALDIIDTALGYKDAPEYHKTLAIVYEALSDIDKAIFEVKKVLEDNPEDVDALIIIAKLYFKNRLYNMAVYYLQKAIDLDYSSLSARGLLVKIYKQQGKYELALEQLNIMLELTSDDMAKYKIYYSISQMYLYLGEYNKAIEIANRYIDRYLKFYRILIRAFISVNDFDKAYQYVSIALNKDSSDAVLYELLSIILLKRKEFDLAIKAIDKAISIKDKENFYIRKIKILYELNDFQKALDVLNIAVSKYKDNDYFYSQIGYCYLNMSDIESAIENYKIAIKLNPSNWQYYKELATIYEQIGDIESAIDNLQNALDKVEDDNIRQVLQEQLTNILNLR